jgi:hypothetical protein
MSMTEIAMIAGHGTDLTRIVDLVTHARGRGESLRFCVDDGALKIKVGNGPWSPPLGVMDPACEAARGCPALAPGLSCVLAGGHEGRHKDPVSGTWRQRDSVPTDGNTGFNQR